MVTRQLFSIYQSQRLCCCHGNPIGGFPAGEAVSKVITVQYYSCARKGAQLITRAVQKTFTNNCQKEHQ